MMRANRMLFPATSVMLLLPAVRRDQAGTLTRSRPLRQYPLVAKYKGSGSTDDAATFCSAGF